MKCMDDFVFHGKVWTREVVVVELNRGSSGNALMGPT